MRPKWLLLAFELQEILRIRRCRYDMWNVKKSNVNKCFGIQLKVDDISWWFVRIFMYERRTMDSIYPWLWENCMKLQRSHLWNAISCNSSFFTLNFIDTQHTTRTVMVYFGWLQHLMSISATVILFIQLELVAHTNCNDWIEMAKCYTVFTCPNKLLRNQYKLNDSEKIINSIEIHRYWFIKIQSINRRNSLIDRMYANINICIWNCVNDWRNQVERYVHLRNIHLEYD